jgi:hypothetical protein
MQHLSDSYPTAIRQTVNAWDWGTCWGEGRRQNGECRIAGQSHHEVKAESRKQKAEMLAKSAYATSMRHQSHLKAC